MKPTEEETTKIVKELGKTTEIKELQLIYKKKHGQSLKIKNALSLIKQFNSLGVYQRGTKFFICLKENIDRIQTVLSKHGGSLSVQNLSILYEKMYGEKIPTPENMLVKTWLATCLTAVVTVVGRQSKNPQIHLKKATNISFCKIKVREKELAQFLKNGRKVISILDLQQIYPCFFDNTSPEIGEEEVLLWNNTFNSLIIHSYNERVFIGLKENVEHIRMILLKHGGSLSVQNLSIHYEKMYGEEIPTPNSWHVKTWLGRCLSEVVSVVGKSKNNAQILLKQTTKSEKRTKEEAVVQFLKRNGKVVDILDLRCIYPDFFHAIGLEIGNENGLSWNNRSNSLFIHSFKKKRFFLGLKESIDRIQTVLLEHGGSLSVQNLSTLYQEMYGEQIPTPKDWLVRTWLRRCFSKFVEVKNSTKPSAQIVLRNSSVEKLSLKIIPSKPNLPLSPNVIQKKRNTSMDLNNNTGKRNSICQSFFGIISSELELKELLLNNDKKAKRLCIHGEIQEDGTIIVVYQGSNFCSLIDCKFTEPTRVGSIIEEHIRESGKVCLIHDLYEHSRIFHTIGLQPNNYFVDTQLVMELLTGNTLSTLIEVANYLNVSTSTLDQGIIYKHVKKTNQCSTLTNSIIQRIIQKVYLLNEVRKKIPNYVNRDQFEYLMKASTVRSKQNYRDIRFIIDKHYLMCSYELAINLYPSQSISKHQKLEVHNNVDLILSLLPSNMKQQLISLGTEYITDLSLDIKRLPHCWWKGERKWLTPTANLKEGSKKRKHEHMLSNSSEGQVDTFLLKEILAKVGQIGTDNRTGFDNELHRISCIRNRKGDIIGVTIRFGRHVSGNVNMIQDLLCNFKESSILFLGEPGCGKTTIIRETIKYMSESENVFVIDTSNEIAGDGDLPHPCIGHARRLMVKSLEDQAEVMIECVQNHTPSVMVIDEIGRYTEVNAAKTVKNRGVRIIASAHGNLRSLLKNQDLRGLIGNLEKVTLGDKEAQKEAEMKNHKEMNKIKTQRAGDPIFEVIIELKRGLHDEWVIISDSAKAVDKILDGKKYDVQRRIRNPDNGCFYVKQDEL